MSIFGRGRPDWTIDADDDDLDETMVSTRKVFRFSERDILENIPPSHEDVLDELSPPPPELPTWDTVPFSNLPEVLGPSFASGYELRPGPRIEAKAIPTTWLDQDSTETYHPNCERDPYLHPPAEIIEGIKRRRPIRPENGLTRSRVPKTVTWQRGRLEGKRLAVTLSFTTKEGRDALASFGSSLDSWPKSAWRLPNEEIDWKSWCDAVPALDEDDSHDSSAGRRERTKTMSRGHDPDGDIEYRALEEVTLGWPEARGCKECFGIDQHCPLLDEGSRYPCDVCVEDGYDCELIMEPAKKRGCMNCDDSGQKRISCSYREVGSNHSFPCENCAGKGLKCLAGPASGRMRTGPALDSAPPGKVHTIRKAFGLSRQINRSKGRCPVNQNTSATKRNKAPKYDEDHCFETAPMQSSGKEIGNTNPAESQGAWTIYPKAYKDETQFIRTRLAHPILLNHKENASCDWCQDGGYGIFGLGPALEVEVLDMNDGNGYVEVSGGYIGAGMDSSRMCTDCTLDRLEIAACLEHHVEDLREIEGIAHETFDPNYVMDFLMPGMAASAPFIWCSICPFPALYTCCKPVNKEIQTLLGAKDDNVGCGLKLCKECAETLVHDVGGDLDGLVHSVQQRDEYELSLRADVDLILRGGEVVRRMGWIFTRGADLA